MPTRVYKRTPEIRAKNSAGMMGKKNAEGYKHAPEARANMRAAQNRPEVKAKKSAAMMGKKKSNRVGNKGFGGHKHTPETKARQSAASNGPNNSQWRGGISRKPYAWTWNAELREEVRRRDGYRCQLCGVPQAECRTKLPVHHVDYDKRNSDPVNLTALCGPCNSKVNANRKHWTELFQAIAIARDIAALKERKSG